MQRNRLLLILPGPLWEIKDSLRKRLEGLSARYQGRLITSMPEAGDQRIGNFTLTALRYRRGGPWKPWMNLKFFLYGCYVALRARFGEESYDLVVTYDPLRTGLIGLLVARLAGAKFAPEVNGVYDSYANYIDGGPRFMLDLKRRLYPRLVGFTWPAPTASRRSSPRRWRPIAIASARPSWSTSSTTWIWNRSAIWARTR
jgi:hypothetical protein